jgi:2-keto-4-pentenoate hydratase/2-oxohepta-3-ene-1,7-dioic acid hydratase in catechol pathway
MGSDSRRRTDLAPGKVEVCTRSKGEVVQPANTADLIFEVPFLVSDTSSSITLLPGHVIYPGMPGTTRAMEDRDVMEINLAAIGPLRHPIRG